MSTWIPVASSTRPSTPGWYPTSSDWGTASSHPGAHYWLGSKWASSCPERIRAFCDEPFTSPHLATSRAFDMDAVTARQVLVKLPEITQELAEAA